MAVTIQVRRGTKAELDGITLAAGELGFTTDTKELFIGDGAGNLITGRCLVGTLASRPLAGESGRFYWATDNSTLYVDDGDSWETIASGAVDSVFSRTGAIVAAASDYDASQVDNDSNVTGTFVDDALNTLNTKATSKNILINGDMSVAQRGISFDSSTTPANNDDTYLIDRTILLSDGNDIADITQDTDAPTGFRFSWKFDVETANKKMGLVKIIEAKNAQHIIDGTASLSFYVKGDGNLANIRAAILAWDSTADTVTSDVISAWAASGTNPTWATNWTAENIPANIALTDGWVRQSIENISIDTANAENIAVVIWLDDTDAEVGESFQITGIQLEEGSVATAFEYKDFGTKLAQCLRYYERIGDSGSVFMIGAGLWGGTTSATGILEYWDKRTTPTIADVGTFAVRSRGNAIATTALIIYPHGTKRGGWAADVATGGTGGEGAYLYNANGVGDYIEIKAEL